MVPLFLVVTVLAVVAFTVSTQGSKSQNAILDSTDPWTKYDPVFIRYGNLYKVDWKMLKAIALNESDLGQNALVKAGKVSSDGKSYGLMQLTLATAHDYRNVDENDLNDPETSIDIAAQFIRHLASVFAGDTRKIVMSYNQGEGNTKKGKTYAEGYYQKFLKNYDRVKNG